MIAIIDYDMGNLRSVAKALEKVGATAAITRDAKTIADATHVVLPGVGAFRDCMKNLEAYGLIEPITKAVTSGKPFLGICLGMQLLFETGMEFGEHRGLGVIKGTVVRFADDMRADGARLKVPHMGWNSASLRKDSSVFAGLDRDTYFYFVHSYYCRPTDTRVVLTTTEYGCEFASAIERDNVTACQFHPEKSQAAGLRILENFSRLR